MWSVTFSPLWPGSPLSPGSPGRPVGPCEDKWIRLGFFLLYVITVRQDWTYKCTYRETIFTFVSLQQKQERTLTFKNKRTPWTRTSTKGLKTWGNQVKLTGWPSFPGAPGWPGPCGPPSPALPGGPGGPLSPGSPFCPGDSCMTQY